MPSALHLPTQTVQLGTCIINCRLGELPPTTYFPTIQVNILLYSSERSIRLLSVLLLEIVLVLVLLWVTLLLPMIFVVGNYYLVSIRL